MTNIQDVLMLTILTVVFLIGYGLGRYDGKALNRRTKQ